MAGRDNAFDMQIKLLMIGDSGEFTGNKIISFRSLLCITVICFVWMLNRCRKDMSVAAIRK